MRSVALSKHVIIVSLLTCGSWWWAKNISNYVFFQDGKNCLFFSSSRYLFEHTEEDDKCAWMILRN